MCKAAISIRSGSRTVLLDPDGTGRRSAATRSAAMRCTMTWPDNSRSGDQSSVRSSIVSQVPCLSLTSILATRDAPNSQPDRPLTRTIPPVSGGTSRSIAAWPGRVALPPTTTASSTTTSTTKPPSTAPTNFAARRIRLPHRAPHAASQRLTVGRTPHQNASPRPI